MSSLISRSGHRPDPDSAVSRLATWRGVVRRRVLVHRRWLAAALTGLAVLLALHDLRPPSASTTPVWTAAHDLSSGQLVTSADLRRTAYPPQTVPDGAVHDPAGLLGRTVAAPLRRGQALTDLSVLGGPLVAAEEGRVAVPVRIADAGVVALLHVGDRIDLVAVDPDTSKEPVLVAVGARVVALPGGGQGNALGGSGDQPGRLLVASVLPSEAVRVAASGASGFLTLTLSP